MKKFIFTLSLIFSCFIFCFSQIEFEKGYFISNDNSRTVCYIKNIDWKNNPTKFEYKLNETSTLNEASINDVIEFGIDMVSKYKRYDVMIDRLGNNISDLDANRNPNLKKETLFLKTLVQGKANLYVYTDGNLRKFFYNSENFNIELLVYKEYLDENNIKKNDKYKQQLFTNLKCNNTLVRNDFEKLKYKTDDLIALFTKFNKCEKSTYTNFEKEKLKNSFFNFYIKLGVGFSSLELINTFNAVEEKFNFDSKRTLNLGIKVEYILPFNKNKWSVFIEPTYQNFKSEFTFNTTTTSQVLVTSNIEYKSIELPIGLQHYIFINDINKVFLSAAYVVDIAFSSSIEFDKILSSLNIKSRPNFCLGLGYVYNDKYNIQATYSLNREILSDYIFWSSNYNTFSIGFAYNIL